MASTVWRGYITFGLISIPVRLFRAARAERVSFRRLHREEPVTPEPAPSRPEPKLTLVRKNAPPEPAPAVPAPAPSPAPTYVPVKQASVREGSDDILPAQAVVKGYEYEKNRFVEIDPEELKSAATKTSEEMQIEEFVALADIDPVYFETSYYLSPEAAGEKAYALLYRSMKQTALVAIAKFAMHNREHVVVIRPGRTGMLAHTMFYASEVRSEDEYRADSSAVNEKELQLAETLIHSLAAPFQPEKYKDTYRERLESLIAAKVQGQPATPVKLPSMQPRVADLTEALNRSLANLKKPAAKASAKPSAVKRK